MVTHLHKICKMAISTSVLTALILLSSCGDSSKDDGASWVSPAKHGTLPPGFSAFVNQWNRQIHDWLDSSIIEQEKNIDEKKRLLTNASDQNQKKAIRNELDEVEHNLQILKERHAGGDYIQFLAPIDIPEGLSWQNGLENPEPGDPKAKKGGTLKIAYNGSFPGTFRPFGPNSNDAFRANLYDNIALRLVELHPENGNIIPGIAKKWAVAPDNKTVYYHLHEDATYSDGSKIRAIDFIVGIFARVSEHSQSFYHSLAYKESVARICIYDDHTLSITLPSQKPLLAYYAACFYPEPAHFYSEFGPNFLENYQWRVPPTSGAYTLDSENLVRGHQIVMKRVENWWAKDKKFYRYKNNVNNVVYLFISDEAKALELFRIGEVDAYSISRPELWHDKMEIPEVHDGYIKKVTFYNKYPQSPLGFYLNVSRPPLNDKNIRLGLHHAMNIPKVIDSVFRGDYHRLGSIASGYGKYTKKSIKARDFSPEKARSFFAKAGYTISGADGILQKDDGTRLSIELTYPNISVSMMNTMALLKEEAKKCGLDLALDGLDSTVMFRKAMEKRHQIVYWAWSAPPPLPSLYQLFFSKYAYDEQGAPVTYSNNINSFASDQMDALLIKERDAKTDRELETVSHDIQQMIHDEALWVPGWTMNFTRLAFWRWVKWPDSPTTRFCYPVVDDPLESYLYWIDENVKSETLKARKAGITYPESEITYDQFRNNNN